MSEKVQHGRSRYVHHRCRCDICVEANRAYLRDYTPPKTWSRTKTPKHGTYNRARRCDCAKCKRAFNRWHSEYQKRRRNGTE